MKNLEDTGEALPYFVPKPQPADEAYDTLFPTSPPPQRPAADDDSMLLPPWVQPGNENQLPLLDD